VKLIKLIFRVANSQDLGWEFSARNILVRMPVAEPRIAKSEYWEIAIAVVS
jgi:hypothetical protein